ncbi:hypothetical protein A1O3_05242 [Capronia epimyces CBS 606.96]|uniref:Ribonuclease P protein subunit n=1 Tax=Capronia epimyces CBS 606.96 TaxID=1182542 RepID=W9XVI1_9EURO|nr:uncharacterized protein A1O3_05242 [Capronia epimyces CBS 606.96]EXJ84572.1 hypothetical protein A1O3_05242 [Capronia epimyces CBS 606.96]
MASTSSPRGGATTPRTASAAPAISHPAHSLLGRGHSPDTAARIFTDKVKNKPLFLASTTTSDKRALRRHIRLRKKEYYLRKRRPKPLSAREKRELGVFVLKKEEVKFEVYLGLHRLWNEYMLEVLGYTSPRKDGPPQTPSQGQQQRGAASSSKVITPQSHGSFLASADFHGAEVEVVRCADPGRVGTRGIVVRDTMFTFVVVTRKNEVRTLPKKDTVFRYEVTLPSPTSVEEQSPAMLGGDAQGQNDGEEPQPQPQPQPQPRRLVFELQGNQFEFRPADRASRKFKWKAMDV